MNRWRLKLGAVCQVRLPPLPQMARCGFTLSSMLRNTHPDQIDKVGVGLFAVVLANLSLEFPLQLLERNAMGHQHVA